MLNKTYFERIQIYDLHNAYAILYYTYVQAYAAMTNELIKLENDYTESDKYEIKTSCYKSFNY